MLLVLPRALAFRMAHSGRVPQRSAPRGSAPKTKAFSALWLHAPRGDDELLDAKTQAILSSLQAQAAAAPELAGDVDI